MGARFQSDQSVRSSYLTPASVYLNLTSSYTAHTFQPKVTLLKLLMPRIIQAPLTQWQSPLHTLISTYSWSTLYPTLERYVVSVRGRSTGPAHRLYFSYRSSRLVISLRDEWKDLTHFFIAPGLLLKYFEGRKSLKRKRALTILMVRFLRKLLLILKLEDVALCVKGVPIYLDALLATLFRPLAHSVQDPLSGKALVEAANSRRNLGFTDVQFFQSKPFGYQKPRKRGRVKRKIRRRIMQTGSVVDAL